MEIWQKHYVDEYTASFKKITGKIHLIATGTAQTSQNFQSPYKGLKENTEVSNSHNHGQTSHKTDTPYSYAPPSTHKYSSQPEVKA